MQNSKKNYSFLLTHTTKSKIYIRRVEISKQLLHSSLAAFLCASALVTVGAIGLSRSSALAKEEFTPENNIVAQVAVPVVVNEPKSPDYVRPESADQYTINSGGPDSDLQITGDDIDSSQSSEIEKRLRAIQAGANPASLPSMWAHSGKINNEFGFRRNPFGGRSYEFHAGMDIDGEKGDEVRAPGGGIVIKAGWQGGYGNMIEIDHGNGITTRYGHLSKIEIEVGATVSRGDLIGLVGSTGRSTGPHLHYELRLNDKPVNPRFFLPQEATVLEKQG